MRALVLLALTNCVSVIEEAGPWEMADAINGELAPELGPPPSTMIDPPATLRIASFNVHYGENAADLAEAIRVSPFADVDVWLLQEIEAHGGEPTTRTRRMAEALGLTWAYAPARTTDHGTHGIAMMSRWPLDRVQVKRLPFMEQPIRSRPRNAMAAEITVGERTLRIVNLHLDVRLGAADRIYQLDPAVIELDPSVPTIVGGDFNTNPWAWVEAAVPLAGTEAIVGMDQTILVDDYLAGLGFTGSIPADTGTVRVPGVAIRADNLYVRDLAFEASGLAEILGSDHWPIWANVPL